MTKYFLHPENIIISDKPATVMTILGSCVSVCLYDTRLKYGGINHYSLPEGNCNSIAKCGDKAISYLIKRMIESGSHKIDLVAKIIGGARMISNDHFSVGDKNVMIARKILNSENIEVLESNTGGNFGRKLVFYTLEGTIKVEILKSQAYVS